MWFFILVRVRRLVKITSFYLASSFLHGRLGLTGSGTALAELVNHNGNYYVVYPPMPAILLLPFVAVFGTSVDQSLMSIALASLCCSLIWLMLTKTGTKGSKALWLTALFGFGTCFWFIAAVGSAWYIEQVTAVLFLTSAILLALYKRNDFFVGFLLGCAYLARLPTILAFPFFLLLIYEHNDAWKPRFKQAVYFLVGLGNPSYFKRVVQLCPLRHVSRHWIHPNNQRRPQLHKWTIQPSPYSTESLRDSFPRTNSPQHFSLF